MTDVELTLQTLRQAGQAGIHSFALVKIVGSIRVGARIYDLKKKGHIISSKSERLGNAQGVRYFLVSSPMEPQKPQYKFDPAQQIYRQI